MANTRAKFGYLTYNDMLQKISDGVLDQHDVIFTKDTKETYIVSPNAEPIALKSKVYVYNSMSEAVKEININTDTYIGQIISVLEGDTYRGYIVNKNTKSRNGSYTIVPLTDISSIDYNTLGNRPIINLTGTLDIPIIVNDLETGIYKIKGQYKISEKEETIYLSVCGDLFLIEKTEKKVSIKRFTKDSIYDFTITDSNIVKNIYITNDYLSKHGYVTSDYVDTKLLALEESIKNNIEEYIESIIVITVDKVIDETLIEKLNEIIQETPNEKVEDLFQ